MKALNLFWLLVMLFQGVVHPVAWSQAKPEVQNDKND
jgi:hypothetical protein